MNNIGKLIFSIFMVAVYLGMACLLLFTDLFINLHIAIRVLMGLLFLIYGVYRAIRLWRSWG